MHADRPVLAYVLAPINKRFGTWRGLVRTVLGQLQLASGSLDEFRLRQPGQVRRVVFVCRGNICRSSFAERLAIGHGLPAASCGLHTRTGARANAAAVAAAARAGIAMDLHRTTDLKDFDLRPGDLLLAMEVGQARELRERLRGRTDVAISLLGLWCPWSMPHLHDPFTLDDAYFDTVFLRIDQAVGALARDLRRSAQASKNLPLPV